MEMTGIVTLDRLATAIVNSPNYKGIVKEDAEDLALRILNFFGYSDRIIDNALETENRDAFYLLEDAGILTTEREETTLYDGREWRIHYWLFRQDKIDRLIAAGEVESKRKAEAGFSMADLPPDAWRRD